MNYYRVYYRQLILGVFAAVSAYHAVDLAWMQNGNKYKQRLLYKAKIAKV